MAKGKKLGRTNQRIMDSTKEDKNTERGPTCGLTGRFTQVFGAAIKFKAKASISGPTAAFIRGSGSIIKCTEKEN